MNKFDKDISSKSIWPHDTSQKEVDICPVNTLESITRITSAEDLLSMATTANMRDAFYAQSG
jgi:hypothetical protein